MGKYINAEDLREVLAPFTEKDSLGHTPVQLCDAMPAVDAVRVIRCKDCVSYCHLVEACKYFNHAHVSGNDYCSHGIRSEK